MAYADDITITCTHTSTSAAKKYLHEVADTGEEPSFLHNSKHLQHLLDKAKQSHTKSRQNNLHSVHARPCRIYEQSGPKNIQQSTTHGNSPNGSGSYLRPKTHIQHTHPQHLSTRTQTSTNQKSTQCNRMGRLMVTYKAVMRPALEYASSVWSPIASSTSINKLQVMQNAALRTATGCTQDTNIQHLHDETLTLPIHKHLQLHASQYKHKTHHIHHIPYTNTQHTSTLQG